MQKLELLTVLHSLKKLHEMGSPDAALEVIETIINEAHGKSPSTKKDSKQD